MPASLYIGLLSGTSMDGIDAALVALSDNPRDTQLIATHLEPIPPDVKKNTLALCTGQEPHFLSVATLDVIWGKLFAHSVQQLLTKANITPEQVRAIGSHGQNIWHQPHPPHPFTWQIGDPNTIATHTNITTVADFRRADVALGGQGAPLVPRFHEWFFTTPTPTARTILNIGGIANITRLPHNNQPCSGFDTGPGNGIMDAWIQQVQQKPHDDNGNFARQGKCHTTLLAHCLSDPYFTQPIPKSTGKEYFNLTWFTQKAQEVGIHIATLSPEDVQATLLALTAHSITQGITQCQTHGEVIICGGGSHNSTLMEALRTTLPPTFHVTTTTKYGLPPDWVEAVCFAWLAKMRIEHKVVDYTQITGARQPTLLGGIYSHST